MPGPDTSGTGFVSMGDGFYTDPSDDTVVIIDPFEILLARDITPTQESVLAVYSQALEEAAADDLSLVLISREGIPTNLDVINAQIDEPEPTVEVVNEYEGEERRRNPRV